MYTNKQCYIDQMVNREVLENTHERMNDEFVAAAAASNGDFADLEEGPSAIMSPPVNPHADFPASGHWCRIARDQSNKVYLPHFLSDPQNATDPAFKVSTASTYCGRIQTLTSHHTRTFITTSFHTS
jgi:hypothetical protein